MHHPITTRISLQNPKDEHDKRNGFFGPILTEKNNALNFNLGGFLNHAFLWKTLAPNSNYEAQASKALKEAIDAKFKSLEALKSRMKSEAMAIQGSGWCWLALDPRDKNLTVTHTANQDTLFDFQGEWWQLGLGSPRAFNEMSLKYFIFETSRLETESSR